MKLIITAIIIALILREILSFCKDRKLQRESMDMSREVESIHDKIREDRSFMRDLEREQRRQARDAEMERVRQAAEIERIAKEQEKQAAQLAKHEEQMAKFEFRLSEAERTIEHYKPLYDTLKRQYDELTAKVKYYESRNLMCGGMKKDLVKVGNQLFTIETKLRKAEFNRDEAERKLSA